MFNRLPVDAIHKNLIKNCENTIQGTRWNTTRNFLNRENLCLFYDKSRQMTKKDVLFKIFKIFKINSSKIWMTIRIGHPALCTVFYTYFIFTEADNGR